MRRWSISAVHPIAGLFGEDFDLRAPPPPEEIFVIEEVATVATFLAEDVAAARRQAWAAGRDAGLKEAADDLAARSNDLLTTIVAQLRDMRAASIAIAEANAHETARLLCAALRAMLPDLCARHGAAEIQAVAAEILASLADERVVRIQVAPENLGLLEAVIKGLDLGSDVAFRLTASDLFGPSDIRIRWQGGEAVRRATELWRRVAEILTRGGFVPATDEPFLKAVTHVQ